MLLIKKLISNGTGAGPPIDRTRDSKIGYANALDQKVDKQRGLYWSTFDKKAVL